MPTISDVARAAGVGTGTVSRVLNGSALVSEATRQRVLAAVERLGYQPNPIARAFGRRRSHTLELLVPLYITSFFLDVLAGIQAALASTDYTLIVRTINGPRERERAFRECCARGRTDGALLVWLGPTSEFVERIEEEHFPVVLLNAVHPRLWSVVADHVQAAAIAVSYCSGLGHRRIALVDRLEDPFDQGSPGICQRGFFEAMAARQLNVPAEYKRVADPSARAGAAAVDALLGLPEPPTAVVAGCEAQALGALDAARSHGARVPQDLSIVGYNDNDYARDLGLTSVTLPLDQIGRQAADLLLEALADSTAKPTTRYVPTTLAVRGTCGPPPGTLSAGPAAT